MSSPPSVPIPSPVPTPHPECTSERHKWIAEAFERNSKWQECENRPWANLHNRDSAGCIGEDFVLHNPRVHMRFFWNEEEQRLAGVIHWQRDAEGPPKGAHGASVATVFDEILAYPVWRSGTGAFTANLNLNLRKMVPLSSTLRFNAGVKERKGKKIYTEGVITSPDEKTVYADCKGLWIQASHMEATQGANVHTKKPTESFTTATIIPAAPTKAKL